MKTRIHTIVLLGALAATSALAKGVPDSKAPDAQAQAANLLRGQSPLPQTSGDSARGHRSAKRSDYLSAQAQAAAVLKGTSSVSESTPTIASDGLRRSTATSKHAGKAVVYQDAQAQAQKLLRGESHQDHNAPSVNVLAVSHP